MPHTNLDSIQVLRGVAAFSVLLFHIGASWVTQFHLFEKNILYVGASGVDLFFVICGFIACYTTREIRHQNIKHYLIKRFVRITPLYWGLTLALGGILFLLPNFIAETTLSWANLFKSLSFIPYDRGDGKLYPILYLGWTLNYEIFFYLLFALSLIIGNTRMLFAGIIIALLGITGQIFKPEFAIGKFYTNLIMIEFIFGGLIYFLYARHTHILKMLIPFWPVFALLLIVQNHFIFDLHRTWKWGIPAALLFSSISVITISQKRNWKWLIKLGDISYSLYLTHPFVIIIMSKLTIAAIGRTPLGAGISAFASIVACLVVSWVLFRFFEVPSNQWLRHKFLKSTA